MGHFIIERRKFMPELYIFNPDDELLAVLSDNEVVEAPIEDLLNQVADDPFVFTVYADEDKAKHVIERNRVVVKDREGDFREFVIDELDDVEDLDGPKTTATCLSSWQFELQKSFVEDRRFTDRTAQFALDVALENTRFIGEVKVELGLASTNFYRLASSDCIWKIMNVWGGEFKDVVVLNDIGRIEQRKIQLLQRRGADNGARFEIDHNMDNIERNLISDPITAMYGWGASLETEGGGNTRYIDFKDVEWSVANGDPVDKPLGQAWVGDPEALEKYGLEHSGELIHLFDEFSNQDYEDPVELLWATWEHLQKNKDPEVNYKMSVDMLDKPVSLGDTAQGIDRNFARPIEVQARVIGIKYDTIEQDEPSVVEMGQFLDLDDDRLGDLERDVESLKNRRPNARVTEDSYPDRKPSTPVNVVANGSFETIQLHWDYADELFIKHYEVYGSQVADFVPDSQHLLWRGQVSAFGHVVETDETWYYYVRAVNYHGTPSDWSERVSASSKRVLTGDIMWGEELAGRMRELHRLSDIIGKGISLENLHDEIPAYMKQEAKEYTDEEIESTRDGILTDVADKYAGIEYVNGQLEYKLDLSKYNSFQKDYSETITEIEEFQESFMRSIQETNVRIDNIDVRGTNFISHLPGNWEEGYYAFRDGSEVNPGSGGLSNRTIRLIDYFNLEADTDYVLTRYLDVDWAAIYLFNIDNSFSRVIHVGYSQNQDEWSAFQTYSDEVKAKVAIAAPYEIEPLSINDDLRVKLSLGTETSGWSPNINDTGQLVADVQEYVSNFEQTSQKIQADISALEVNVGEHGERISNTEGKVELHASLINNKLEQNVFDSYTDSVNNRLTEYRQDLDSISTSVSNIRIGGRNLIPNSKGDSLEGWSAWRGTDLRIIDDVIRVRKGAEATSYGVSTNSFEVEEGQEYTFSLYIASNYRTDILDYMFLYFGSNEENQRLPHIRMDHGHGDLRRYTITFTAEKNGDASILIGANTKEAGYDSEGFLVRKVQLEAGNMASDWDYSSDDFTQEMSVMRTDITQLEDEIDLKVNVDEIVTEINLNREGIRFKGDLLHLDGLSLIDDGIIQNAHIANASIEKAHLQQAIIDDAHIDEITGRVITAGTITTDHLNVSYLSAISQDVGTLTGGIIRDQNGRTELNLNRGELYLREGSVTIERPDGIRWVQDGIPRFNYNVQMENFFETGVEWTGQWYETKQRGSRAYKIASFRHEGRYLKMNVLTRLSGYSPSTSEWMYYGVKPLNGNVVRVNHIERVMVFEGESQSHVLTIDMGSPTYQEVSIYLVLYKERREDGGTHDDNIVQVRTNRIWQEG